MKILSASQIRDWDAYTIANEPIASIDLMERASAAAAAYIINYFTEEKFVIFCGPGNNGGDGLAIARLLIQQGKKLQIFALQNDKFSPDFTINLNRLKVLGKEVFFIEKETDFSTLSSPSIIIDALYGTGLNRKLDGLSAALVDSINQQNVPVISIDMPSGLLADKASDGEYIIKADTTLSFQCAKLAFFMAENAVYVGNFKLLEIGLHKGFQASTDLQWVLPDSPFLQLKKYSKHAYKGKLGHALISAGSQGKMGAAVMAAKACLHSGSGLLTMAVPEAFFDIIHTTTPEAMCHPQQEAGDATFLTASKINAVGAGSGWALSALYETLLQSLIINTNCPLLLDASALYHLAANIDLLQLRPKNTATIITPHIGEFERLFGKCANGFERLQLAIEKAVALKLHIVLKGAYTQVICPEGKVYINSTGNPGMAKGGSGDVLTGIITSLLAQGYSALQASVLGVYAHGLAGDIAAKKMTEFAMTPMNLVECLVNAWQQLELQK